jgi:hypothetical protein
MMASSVPPILKAIYLCDEVVEDPVSKKVSVLGAFNVVRPPSSYPYHLPKLCVLAKLAGGLGEVPVRVVIARASDQCPVYTSTERLLRFEDRHQMIYVLFRILNCPFPTAGAYLVELHSRDNFLDDHRLHLLPEETSE